MACKSGGAGASVKEARRLEKTRRRIRVCEHRCMDGRTIVGAGGSNLGKEGPAVPLDRKRASIVEVSKMGRIDAGPTCQLEFENNFTLTTLIGHTNANDLTLLTRSPIKNREVQNALKRDRTHPISHDRMHHGVRSFPVFLHEMIKHGFNFTPDADETLFSISSLSSLMY